MSRHPGPRQRGQVKVFPVVDLIDEGACYELLVSILHPGGLAFPRCEVREGLKVDRRYRGTVLDYRCPGCGRVF